MERTLWIARDRDGSLLLYKRRPIKIEDFWQTYDYTFIRLDNTLFPEVKWEDLVPTKVQLKILK